MIIIQESNWSDEIKVPVEVATCPDCSTQLTISPDGWTEVGDGSGMVCSSFTLWCEKEPDLQYAHEWDQFWASHPSFEMPYVYRLPVDIKIEKWLKENYRFVEEVNES